MFVASFWCFSLLKTFTLANVNIAFKQIQRYIQFWLALSLPSKHQKGAHKIIKLHIKFKFKFKSHMQINNLLLLSLFHTLPNCFPVSQQQQLLVFWCFECLRAKLLVLWMSSCFFIKVFVWMVQLRASGVSFSFDLSVCLFVCISLFVCNELLL